MTEREYRRAEQEARETLAQAIQSCGISISELSRETRVSRKTIMRALRQECGVRMDTEARLLAYADYKLKQKQRYESDKN